jgi:hypothetical protein
MSDGTGVIGVIGLHSNELDMCRSRLYAHGKADLVLEFIINLRYLCISELEFHGTP